MSLPPWRSNLAASLHRNRSLIYSRYLQLATIRPDGTPANRTIVFRGFLENTNSLKFVTDSRTQKTQQINHNAAAEACWYFPKTREQYRISGKLILITANYHDLTLQKARQIAWQDLSETARKQFTWPEPGQPKSENTPAFTPSLPDINEPLLNFCLLLLEPETIDYLELKGEPQNRMIYTKHNLENNIENWLIQAVNP